MEKMAWGGPKWGRKDCFPTNPDLADILGRTDLIFETFYFSIFLTPNFSISRSPDLQISGFPGPQISKFPDLQIPRFPGSRFPDAAGAAACGRTLRSQLDPSPNAPRDQICRNEPLLPCCLLMNALLTFLGRIVFPC